MRSKTLILTSSFLAVAWLAPVAPTFASREPHPPVARTPTHLVKPKPVHPETPKGAGATAKTRKTAPPKPPSFVAHIERNPHLLSRVQALLPSGMTLQSAAQGFKNRGQFIAALHVSRNLNIPFAQLKAEMTGPDHDKLGRAIHELRPEIDAKAAVKAANREAKLDVRGTGHVTAGDHDADSR